MLADRTAATATSADGTCMSWPASAVVVISLDVVASGNGAAGHSSSDPPLLRLFSIHPGFEADGFGPLRCFGCALGAASGPAADILFLSKQNGEPGSMLLPSLSVWTRESTKVSESDMKR